MDFSFRICDLKKNWNLGKHPDAPRQAKYKYRLCKVTRRRGGTRTEPELGFVFSQEVWNRGSYN